MKEGTGNRRDSVYLHRPSPKRILLSYRAIAQPYYSRSRQQLWHKGQSSELVQKVQNLAIDDDQDCLWMQVKVGRRKQLIDTV